MSYGIKKLIDIITIFANNNQKLDILRISKLLYFIDKEHLIKYGKDVLGDIVVRGDKYYRFDYGPVPSQTLDLLNELFDSDSEYNVAGNRIKKNILSEYLEFISSYQLKLKKPSNFEALSSSEIEIIQAVLKNLGSLNTSDLVELSIRDATWEKTNP